MLTIFASPKPFKGHFGIIQRNAIESWIRLRPAPQVILFGDSEGTREVAAEFGIEHVPVVETNEFGTPYLRSLIENAERSARHPFLCFVNADIILTAGFAKAVSSVCVPGVREFLLIGARMNLDVGAPIKFDTGWCNWLEQECRKRGTPGAPTGMDFFVFPRGFYWGIPPVVVGRGWVDQWMVKAARDRAAEIIDCTTFMPIVHQNHDYTHLEGGQDSAYRGIEAKRNLSYCGEQRDDRLLSNTLLDCTHWLTTRGQLKRVWLRRSRYELRHMLWRTFVQKTVSVREKLKLRRKYWAGAIGNSQDSGHEDQRHHSNTQPA